MQTNFLTNHKQIDWKHTEMYAKSLTFDQLDYAIRDCIECVMLNIDEGYYLDCISVFRAEIRRRNAIKKNQGETNVSSNI